MAWSALQLRQILFVGPGKQPAALAFRSGVNVICGASDAGKSFVVEAIDFLLGGNEPLRDIPERVGYDRAFISLSTTEEELYTFERSVNGGNFRIYHGEINSENLDESSAGVLKAAHAQGREDNLSGWLLARSGLLNKRLRKNSNDETRGLSFRDIARIMVVQEEEVIRRSSPFLSGQFVTKTAEKSVLKLLLTGVDDSAVVPSEATAPGRDNSDAKIELLDQMLRDLSDQIADIGGDRLEIEDQLRRLEEALAGKRAEIYLRRQNLNLKAVERSRALQERTSVQDRFNEISELSTRFALLDEHYKVDLERLAAVEESGSLFFHQAAASCPLCGAEAHEQHRAGSCDGDVERVVLAARQEAQKIEKLSTDLKNTVSDLKQEAHELSNAYRDADLRFKAAQLEIDAIATSGLDGEEEDYDLMLAKRDELKEALGIFWQQHKLNEQREALLNPSDDEVGRSDPAQDTTALSRSVMDRLAQKVESVLSAWNFPGCERVYFDETTFDFVIDGKPRGSRGKGLRAITHAAVTIGLLEFCKDYGLPHPGFVVIDSPLLAYWAPEGSDDSLQGTDLKDKFYEYLIERHSDSQIVLIENEHPSDRFVNNLSLTVFSKNPSVGRFGFFSHLA